MSFLCGVTDDSGASVSVASHCEDSELSDQLSIKMLAALNRPIDDWGKLLGDTAAVTAMLDRLLHHGHVLKCDPRSWRTKTQLLEDDKNEK